MSLRSVGRALVALSMLVLVSGCSDAGWDSLNIFPALGDTGARATASVAPVSPEEAAAQPAPAAPSAPDQTADDFCKQAAAAAASDARNDGFNAASVQQRYEIRLRQCVELMRQ